MKENENTEQSSVKKRLLDFLKHIGISQSQFEKTCKLSNGYVNNIRKSIKAEKFDENIAPNFPELNKTWLLFGDGGMLNRDSQSKTVPEDLVDKVKGNRKTLDSIYDIQTIPLYDSVATLGISEIFDGTERGNILSYLTIPNLPKSDGAIFMTGDSMYPLLKSGDIVALKIINNLDIIYGEMYYVEYYGEDQSTEFKVIKYVKKSEIGTDHVKLVSYNQHHEPKDILINRIRTIAIVNASVRYNRL